MYLVLVLNLYTWHNCYWDIRYREGGVLLSRVHRTIIFLLLPLYEYIWETRLCGNGSDGSFCGEEEGRKKGKKIISS